MTINNESYANRSDITSSEPGDSSAISGDGGGVMDVWTQSREEKLDLAKGGNYTNESSFSIPPGFIAVNQGHSMQEKNMGTSFSGIALGTDGRAISGSAVLLLDGNILGSISVSGSFIASFQPFAGVVSGDTDKGTKIPALDAGFVPSSSGVTSVTENISYPSGTSVSASYGRVEGSVLDAKGNPIGGEPVVATGASATTDASGFYSILVPGGESVDLTSLSQTTTKGVLGESQKTKTLDFEYSGVSVSVKLPGGRPAKDVPVSLGITGEILNTDETGRAQFLTVPPNSTGIVKVFSSIEKTVTSLSGGQISDKEIEAGAGFTGKVVNENTNNIVAETDVKLVSETSEYKGSNPSSGEFYVASNENGTVFIIVAEKDRRYEKTVVEVVASGGNTETINIPVSPKKNTSRY